MPEIIPPPLVRRSWRAQILAKTEVAPRHFQLKIAAPELAEFAQPGQFLHIKTQTLPSLTAPSIFGNPLLRRAFSIMAVDSQTVEILFRVEGEGTQLLSRASKGEFVDVIGPLGRGFDLTAFHVKQMVPTRAILVGGGVGVPPLVFLAARLKNLKVETTAVLGARTSQDVLCERELSVLGVSTSICTDDGSRGLQGRVTDLLKPLLRAPDAIVFSCGPLPMLRAVTALCRSHEQNCQVSLEENMPCGIGVCNGCVVRVYPRGTDTDGGSDYELYRRVCVDGPVCQGEEIDWEANTHGA